MLYLSQFLTAKASVLMQLQNSYIFLPNPYKKKDKVQRKQDNITRVQMNDSFVSCLRSAFPIAVRDADHSLFIKEPVIKAPANT